MYIIPSEQCREQKEAGGAKNIEGCCDTGKQVEPECD
jgi:hypothetical protein